MPQAGNLVISDITSDYATLAIIGPLTSQIVSCVEGMERADLNSVTKVSVLNAFQ